MAPEIVDVSLSDGRRAWQFGERYEIGDLLRREIGRRQKGRRHEADYDWRSLVDQSLGNTPEDPDEAANEELARQEKAAALEELVSARFSLLLGAAGTGKTHFYRCSATSRKCEATDFFSSRRPARREFRCNRTSRGLRR